MVNMLANPPTSSTSFNSTSFLDVNRKSKRISEGRDGFSKSSTDKQPLWIPMLQSASKGKDLSEKQLILLGGNSDLQRDFLEQLNPEPSRQNLRSNDRRRQKQDIPISNKFALGYTYHDVLDADQEDVLARLNVYMLTSPSGQLGALLRPLLTPKTIKDTLITIILDWSDPFKWARQLRQWIRLLRKVILSLDEETKIEMEENMNLWKEKRTGPDAQVSAQSDVVAPLGPGEWDEGLGIALSVACVQSEKIERLERELGWGDDQFDFLQQWLRTVLLKHGGSLVYTASFDANNVKTLTHSNLNIQSLLKREVAKHNVIDRDKILVPPNWDSWGKIRILREGFDPETVSNSWSVEIQDAPDDVLDLTTTTTKNKQETEAEIIASASAEDSNLTSAVAFYEQSLPNPVEPQSSSYKTAVSTDITVTATPLQEFLQSQSTILEKLKSEDAAAGVDKPHRTTRPGLPSTLSSSYLHDNNDSGGSGSTSPVRHLNTGGSVNVSARMTENIGPYQINVNGIDFDAEEATRRLRERENERVSRARDRDPHQLQHLDRTNSASGVSTPTKRSAGDAASSGGTGTQTQDGKPSNEALHGFFANLIKKGEQGRQRGGGGGSGAAGLASGSVSPRRESPAPTPLRRDD